LKIGQYLTKFRRTKQSMPVFGPPSILQHIQVSEHVNDIINLLILLSLIEVREPKRVCDKRIV